MLFAQKLALENQLKLSIVVGINKNWELQREATQRYLDFYLKGAEEVAAEASELNIQFIFMPNFTSKKLGEFVENERVNCVVCDFGPLRKHVRIVDKLRERMEKLEGSP